MKPYAVVRPAEKTDLPVIRELAEKIWPPTYAHILDAGQMAYMMTQMYSPDSLLRQITEYHHRFLILEYGSIPSGFASYAIYPEEAKGKLQKIYVDPSLQGKGLGKLLLDEVVLQVKGADCRLLQLNVNRRNRARTFYESQGFFVVKEEDIDIGNGYFMNDFVMEKKMG
jgi:ribosomal protein S18 acetylase RimI-like enzyme